MRVVSTHACQDLMSSTSSPCQRWAYAAASIAAGEELSVLQVTLVLQSSRSCVFVACLRPLMHQVALTYPDCDMMPFIIAMQLLSLYNSDVRAPLTYSVCPFSLEGATLPTQIYTPSQIYKPSFTLVGIIHGISGVLCMFRPLE